MASKNKGEKKQHIQVFTRVRPLNSQELRSPVVVECVNTKAVSVRDKCQTKTFTFDRVFGPDSKQIEVYKVVVSPLISEVLQGYNCTVFAYGQTGTGKTYTMIGDKSDNCNDNWENDPNCGVIPRTLSHLFDELKVRADEFTVRVSFLELYNEELCDLLAPNDGDEGKNLKLFEDSMKKGSVIVSGLEERTVHNKSDVYAILEAGNLRRQTAATLMNALSSRSHTIFTITVHIKVTTPEGEDLIKTGKLNLVDLAGSENIGRSGAVDLRAREAGNINQSLLTLGRVITSLVERGPHVPYRESKLTRILQDSLGGRTKTSIIATVSPAYCNIEETLSTFDYAHRARNITNKPEINQKTSKHVLLKEYTEEIERLRRDLNATREKHGVYLASENYNAILSEKENLNKELVSKLQLLKMREDELKKQEDILKSLNMDLFATQSELAATSQKLEEATKLCLEKEDMLSELSRQTNALVKTADEAINDAQTLHDRLAKSQRILEHNYTSAEKFKNLFCWNLDNMKSRTNEFVTEGINEVENQITAEHNFVRFLMDNQTVLEQMTNNTVQETTSQIEFTFDLFTKKINSSQDFLNEQLDALKRMADSQDEKAHEIATNLTDHAENMKFHNRELLNAIEKHKKMLENQSTEIQQIREGLTNLTKITLFIPAIYNAKLKERDEALKLYAEKYEFLEKNHSAARKQIQEFGHTLYKMAQEHVELLQRENECEEALKTIQNDQKYKEEKLFDELAETMHKNFADMNVQSVEMETISKKIGQSTEDVINNSTKFIIPLINEMATTEEQWSSSMEGVVAESIAALKKDFLKLKDQCETESDHNIPYLESIENKLADTIRSINKLAHGVNENSNILKARAENNLEDNLARNELISSQITDYSNEILSKIQNRLNEIESFFSDNMKRYERTGHTPQRKEFSYPRGILQSINRIPQIESPDKQHVIGINDTIAKHDLSIGEENISNA